MTIKNYSELAITPLREKALQIVDAGIEAIKPENILSERVCLRGDVLSVGKEKIDTASFRNIFVVGIGKASFKAAAFLEKTLGDRITDGAVIDIMGGKLKKIRSYKGTHPMPTEANIAATNEIIKILGRAGKNDLVIAIISGGGSSLLCQPNRMTCVSLQQINQALFHKGADIKDMNTIRKHISKIHGGNLARLAYPAKVVSLIFSDIPFADLSMVASGPTYFDKTTKKDAEAILKKYGLPKIPLTETPKIGKYFDRVSNVLVLDNKVALRAMKKKAEELGFDARICSACLRGEAKKVGKRLADDLNKEKSGTALIFGGETTVIVEKKGKGGRNLEVVLGALNHMREGQLMISISSDGKDHIKEAAGAIGDEIIKEKMSKAGYDADFFLNENRSYFFFKELGGVIATGETGSNVSDLMLAISEK